jgi:hypothetical protein
VVDEQAGIVLLWMNFGDTHSYGPGRALVTFEAFKIFGESIHAINAFRLPAQGNRAQLAVGEVIDGAHCDLAPKIFRGHVPLHFIQKNNHEDHLSELRFTAPSRVARNGSNDIHLQGAG